MLLSTKNTATFVKTNICHKMLLLPTAFEKFQKVINYANFISNICFEKSSLGCSFYTSTHFLNVIETVSVQTPGIEATIFERIRSR